MLGEAKDRNFEKWPGVLQNDETYDSKIVELKQWITNRLAWIDSNIDQIATGVQTRATEISEFACAQNYPNPFNPETTIFFTIPHASHVQLLIYNSAGRQIAELMHKDLSAGMHEVVWNAEHFSSGLYFYRLNINGRILTRQMILLK